MQSNPTATISGDRVSVLLGMIDREHFDKYQDWLHRHVGAYNSGWRVKFLSETGIRTMVVFDSPRHKLLFDIAWADSVAPIHQDVPERLGWQ